MSTETAIKTKDTTVRIKAMTDDSVTVEGYGVVFGGVDLEGETFLSETDYMLDLVPDKLVLYDHGMNADVKAAVLGSVKAGSIEDDGNGLWIEAELNRHAAYMDYVLELAEQGVLGWSSGTVGHLASRDGKTIKRWPIVEFSLTPTPAEPRTLGVQQLKALADSLPALTELTSVAPAAVDIYESEQTEPGAGEPKDASAASAPAGKSADDSTVKIELSIRAEDTHVSEDTKTTDQVADSTAELNAVLDAVKGIGATVTQAQEASQKALDEMAARIEAIENEPVVELEVQVDETPRAPIVKKFGDSEDAAIAHWYRTGDTKAVSHLHAGDNAISIKASNDTDMNVGTAADGGNTVPTGHYNGIIARMHEGSLYQQLGVTMIPGKGTTVNVPIDNEADGEFVSTAEAGTMDRDAPALGQVALTLVKYTKKIELSYELLEDEDSRLLSFLEGWVGTGLARTHNSLLVTEVLANGTAGLTLDAAAAIGAAEIPELMYKLKGEYADGAAWLMARATEGYLRGLTGNNFQFVPTPMGSIAGSQASVSSSRELFGAPIFNSAYMPAIATGNKTLVFGNFSKVGLYMAPDITFLRDPYSAANTGQVRLHYYTRVDYGTLIAEAIQYATQA